MGGIQELAAVQTIQRQGRIQTSLLGQGSSSAEMLLVQEPTPFVQIRDFTVPRQVTLTGASKSRQTADWQKGGIQDRSGGAMRMLDSTELEDFYRESERDIVRFLVNALGPKSRIASNVGRDASGDAVVSVHMPDSVTYAVHVDGSNNLIRQIDFTEDRGPFGDVAKERTFSDYRQVAKLRLPFVVTTREMGFITEKLAWSTMTVAVPLEESLFTIPAVFQSSAQKLARASSVPVSVTKLADGVFFGEGLHLNNMWVEFRDFVLVAEGPGHELHSEAVLRKIRETSGGKPVGYLVNTHHHADHSGGIRTYAALGATILTQQNNEAAIRQILDRPHTLKPDRLTRSGIRPKVDPVGERKTISDGSRTVELLHVPNPHANGHLLVYLPKEKILFTSDMFHVLQGQTASAKPHGPHTRMFYDAVNRMGWQVDQIVSGHGRLLKWSELVAVMEEGQR